MTKDSLKIPGFMQQIISTEPRQIDQANFTNSFVEELRGEVGLDKRSRPVPGYCYSRVEPTPVRDPRLIAWSDDLAAFLGLTQPAERGAAVDVLAGNLITPTMKPFAARYGGHQFGSWAGQLGDGRAISLGEIEAYDGSYWEIQLKGAGPTPYSRRADGRAVLRSSLREFLCSEAMYYLGVPTTRALSLVGTGDTVVRDMFYSGDPRPEPGAIVARVAPTFIRFGNFELMTASGETENLRALADYVIRHHYPELGEPSEEAYLAWFEEICRRTAVMLAHWMSVGFVHGVMNTDNMSILGITIDYGPYGWLEPYDPDWTPNTTDFGYRRYAFGQQPRVALWNLMMLARALSPLVPNIEDFSRGLERYRSTLLETQHEMMLRKLGLTSMAGESDELLIEDLPQNMADSEIDMTLFFRHLSHMSADLISNCESEELLFGSLIQMTSYANPGGQGDEGLLQWLHRYAQRLRKEPCSVKSIRERMLSANPKYVLRNYLAQKAIDGAEAGDLSFLQTLMSALKTPYAEQPEHDDLSAKRPDWARDKPGCATLSCSS
ncbi:MAG TPA: YdiU family protein [Abditibacteriaceae bacterium]|nr:YdiU family protein [Abditibacteriaceae bacterium]